MQVKSKIPNHQQKQTGRVEIDQSVRVEEPNDDTIIGLANNEVAFALKVPRRAKRRVREEFQRHGAPKKSSPYTFAVSIVAALKRAPFRTSDVVVDIEYPGYEQEILQIIQEHLPHLNLYFTAIGKKSPAHYVAYGVHLGKQKADGHVGARELLQLIRATKNGYRIVTHPDKPSDSQST